MSIQQLFGSVLIGLSLWAVIIAAIIIVFGG